MMTRQASFAPAYLKHRGTAVDKRGQRDATHGDRRGVGGAPAARRQHGQFAEADVCEGFVRLAAGSLRTSTEPKSKNDVPSG